MQIQKKLLIALTILALFVAVTGILGILYTTSINEKLKVVTSKTNPTVETVDDLIITIWKGAKTTEELSGARSAEELSALEKKFESSRSNFVKIKEIAYNLGLCSNTVRNHLRSVFLKTAVMSRVQLLNAFRRQIDG